LLLTSTQQRSEVIETCIETAIRSADSGDASHDPRCSFPNADTMKSHSVVSSWSSTDARVRLTALQILADPTPERCSFLYSLTRRQWQQLEHWFDVSGLALYFFNQLRESRCVAALPPNVSSRMEMKLKDNKARTRGLIGESIAIQREFQRRDLRYCVHKGFSLWPHSVPSLELRSQLDLDFLVAGNSAQFARRILENRGYRLYAESGGIWEFKRNEKPGVTLKDLYRDQGSYAIELHIVPEVSEARSQLDRLEWRKIYGLRMPVLSPVDLFLRQGLHAYKDICAEFMRVAHLWEFRRHVLSRLNDRDFWRLLRKTAVDDNSASLRLGVSLLVIAEVMGEFAPLELTEWTSSRVPGPARFWVKKFAHRAATASFPGSKRYLLLQESLEDAGVSPRRPRSEAIIPRRLPPMVIRPFPNETQAARLARNWIQLRFIAHRLSFHVIGGLNYWWEVLFWRRQLKKVSGGSISQCH
jgi:hypothetical protein